ncbi:MAG TPA: hypothetical protein VJN70_02335 [Gemmatimonadaceae bacterium]|nr:hypothetical protein [Gemmatimonadaceae bacterium]
MTASQGSFASAALPYGLTPPVFRFRALAGLAGRAALGGPREVALATFLVARLVDDCLPQRELALTARVERSAAARGWLGSVALPTAVRAPLTKLADATAGNLADVSVALANAISAVDAYLDAAARLELDRLASAFGK